MATEKIVQIRGDVMVVRDNRVTVTLPEKLLTFLNSEVQRRGINPKKKGTILVELLSREFDHVNNNNGYPTDNETVNCAGQ